MSLASGWNAKPEYTYHVKNEVKPELRLLRADARKAQHVTENCRSCGSRRRAGASSDNRQLPIVAHLPVVAPILLDQLMVLSML